MYDFDPRTDRPMRKPEREAINQPGAKSRISTAMSLIRDGSIAIACLCFAFSYLPGHAPVYPETSALYDEAPAGDTAQAEDATQMTGEAPVSYVGYEEQSRQVETLLLKRAGEIKAKGLMVKTGASQPSDLATQAPVKPGASSEKPEQASAPAAPTKQEGGSTGTVHSAPFVDEQAAASIQTKRNAFTGDKALVRVGYHIDGTRMTPAEKAEQVRALFASIPDEWTVVYKSPQEKLRMYVFTDTTCPYCRRLHEAMPELNAAGVTVQYFLFPRDMAAAGGAMTPTAENMNNAWCSLNKHEAFDAAFQGYKIPEADCKSLPEGDIRINKPAQQHFTMARQIFDVEATPTIFTSTGVSTAGFSSVSKLLQNIGL